MTNQERKTEERFLFSAFSKSKTSWNEQEHSLLIFLSNNSAEFYKSWTTTKTGDVSRASFSLLFQH